MGILSRFFSKRSQRAPVAAEVPFDPNTATGGEMEPGDPLFDHIFHLVMEGNTVVGNKRADGTWDLEVEKAK